MHGDGNAAGTMVSVIMPFRDAGVFFEESIESVRSQTHERWELLLIDDGSTDGSSAVARHFVRQDPGRIRYLGSEGGESAGASAARNLGLMHAVGEIIAFLDADDVWLPRKLEEQLELLAAHPEAGMLYGRTLYWYSWAPDAGNASADYPTELGFPPDSLLDPPLVLTAALQGEAPLPCMCSFVVRRPVIDAAGTFDESFKRVFTDQVFLTRMLLAAPVYVADACWDLYRQHPASSVAAAERAGILSTERLRYLAWAAEYLESRGMRGSAAWRCIREERLHLRLPRSYLLAKRVVRAARAGAATLRSPLHWLRRGDPR
jgi:glycosyltransferase involved in cell wall biosynthesis